MNMKRRDFIKSTGIGLCYAAMPLVSTANQSDKKPNIILCMADDQGWGDMAYNGHPVLKTPNFDDMASSALRFDRFYAAAPVCSPTRGSVMTGRHPNRFGCFKWGNVIRPQEISIAEALKTAGYTTGHFGKWHLGSVQSGSPVNPGANGFDEWFSAPNFFDNDPILSRQGNAVQTIGESSMVTVDAAIEFIRQKSQSNQPFLAVVWFGSPHLPHRARDNDRQPYRNQDEKLQHFYGEITAMDQAFGKLRRSLRDLEIQDDTLLWYCSDNGGLPNVGSTGGRGHKGQIYEGGLRVPAIMEWPSRIKKPGVCPMPCNTVDIYPTLLEIAGVNLENQLPLDGISLLPAIKSEMKSRPKPMGFWDYASKGIGTPSAKFMAELLAAQKRGQQISDIAKLRLDSIEITKQYPENSFPGHSAWLDWPWKLHRIQDKEDNVKFELYNLDVDPLESEDLTSKNTKQVQALKPELNKWLVSVVRSLNGEDYFEK